MIVGGQPSPQSGAAYQRLASDLEDYHIRYKAFESREIFWRKFFGLVFLLHLVITIVAISTLNSKITKNQVERVSGNFQTTSDNAKFELLRDKHPVAGFVLSENNVVWYFNSSEKSKGIVFTKGKAIAMLDDSEQNTHDIDLTEKKEDQLSFVGINTAVPSAPLDVRGDAEIRGDLLVEGQLDLPTCSVMVGDLCETLTSMLKDIKDMSIRKR